MNNRIDMINRQIEILDNMYSRTHQLDQPTLVKYLVLRQDLVNDRKEFESK